VTAIVNVMVAPPMPFIPQPYQGKLVVMILMCSIGDTDASARAVAPFKAGAEPIVDMVRPIRYPEARALHTLSQRPGELVAVNVAGLDDTLFSDTLFGHARGAYTGADRQREGLLTTAADGTLFLDEIGDLTVPSQVKLLRLLQDGVYYPLGADRPRQSRARVIVATNADVTQRVAAGSFRRDLYYRLRTHHLQLPPLRDRLGDLPLLVRHFVDASARVLNKGVPAIPPALYALLKSYRFPGNVRELEAMVFDAVTRAGVAGARVRLPRAP
jgi:two-component system nitrogen regulation response regulator GlnG